MVRTLTSLARVQSKSMSGLRRARIQGHIARGAGLRVATSRDLSAPQFRISRSNFRSLQVGRLSGTSGLGSSYDQIVRGLSLGKPIQGLPIQFEAGQSLLRSQFRVEESATTFPPMIGVLSVMSGLWMIYRGTSLVLKILAEAILKDELQGVSMDSFLDRGELERLTQAERKILERNIVIGARENARFSRSGYYPFPRDLCFAGEKEMLQKWVEGRRSVVEIGVFEGASSLALRKAMHSAGILHLIDPFIKVPDSELCSRPIMAKLNVLRSLNGQVKWYQDYSYNVVQIWDTPIELLFIDGDHSEAACWDDWNSWYPYVVKGGIAIFHDARFGKGDGSFWDGWPGPTKVVDELFRGANKLPNWEIVDEISSVVVVRRVD